MTFSPALPQEQLFEALQESAQPGQYARQYLEQGQERLNQAFASTDITELGGWRNYIAALNKKESL